MDCYKNQAGCSFLGKEGRRAALRASDGRPLFYLREEKSRWVLACFPFSCEDLTEALLEFTAALTHLEMLPLCPLSWPLVGLKTQYMQSPCD